MTYAMDVDDYFIREDERPYENLGKKLPLATDQDREHPKARSSEEPFQPHEQKHLADSLGLPASIADEIEQALKVKLFSQTVTEVSGNRTTTFVLFGLILLHFCLSVLNIIEMSIEL